MSTKTSRVRPARTGVANRANRDKLHRSTQLLRAVPETVTMNATDAKNQMGRMLETVMQGGVVLITRHDAPKAAVIPFSDYERYTRAGEDQLNALRGEFDQMLAGMQTPDARAGMQAAFDASPEQLARAAVKFARKRG